jgi:hypothetical protein
MVSGFIASQGQRTETVFEIHSCKPLIGIKWEEGWGKPVSRWRQELGIAPVATGEASWYDTVRHAGLKSAPLVVETKSD